VLYVLKGGVLAPIFTGNALREKGRGGQAPFNMPLEIAGGAALLLLAACDLGAAPPAWTGSLRAGLRAALRLALRALAGLARGRRAAGAGDAPRLRLAGIGLRAQGRRRTDRLVPEAAWLHAFTVGSLGLMMLGLMTRVSLRHTGRPLVVPRAMLVAYALMFAAACCAWRRQCMASAAA
jgi:uncharacterized protein involved in response to NO